MLKGLKIAYISSSYLYLLCCYFKIFVHGSMISGALILYGTGFWDVVANVLGCEIEVSEFKLQSRYYVHLPTNTLRNV